MPDISVLIRLFVNSTFVDFGFEREVTLLSCALSADGRWVVAGDLVSERVLEVVGLTAT